MSARQTLSDEWVRPVALADATISGVIRTSMVAESAIWRAVYLIVGWALVRCRKRPKPVREADYHTRMKLCPQLRCWLPACRRSRSCGPRSGGVQLFGGRLSRGSTVFARRWAAIRRCWPDPAAVPTWRLATGSRLHRGRPRCAPWRDKNWRSGHDVAQRMPRRKAPLQAD